VSPKLGVAPVRRGQIIQATIRCLARDGASGLRMKSVAREARVSQAILHYYFENKRAIFIAALETVMRDLNARLARLLEGTRDPRVRLRAVIGGCLSLADENREFWIVFVEFWGEMMHDEELMRFNAALYRQFRRTLGALVAQGARAGHFRSVDAVEAGAVILALVDGISLQRTFEPGVLSLERATRVCADAAARYLAPSAPKSSQFSSSRVSRKLGVKVSRK
jgi:AcrR family transcriptional regulator